MCVSQRWLILFDTHRIWVTWLNRCWSALAFETKEMMTENNIVIESWYNVGGNSGGVISVQ